MKRVGVGLVEMGTVEFKDWCADWVEFWCGDAKSSKTKEMRCEKEVTGWAAGKMKQVRLDEWTLDVMR